MSPPIMRAVSDPFIVVAIPSEIVNSRKSSPAALPVQFFPVFSTEHLLGRSYFRKTKKTARTRHTKAARWFQWRDSPLKRRVTTKVKTMRETTSWITFSCIRLNGPPLPLKPRRLAGTWAQYSKNASPQEKRMTRMSGQLVETFIS